MRIVVEFSCFEDMDGDSYVSIEEFTERCMQLHGPARSADLFALRHQAVSWSRFRRFFHFIYHFDLVPCSYFPFRTRAIRKITKFK
jgi:hypothetical protein